MERPLHVWGSVCLRLFLLMFTCFSYVYVFLLKSLFVSFCMCTSIDVSVQIVFIISLRFAIFYQGFIDSVPEVVCLFLSWGQGQSHDWLEFPGASGGFHRDISRGDWDLAGRLSQGDLGSLDWMSEIMGLSDHFIQGSTCGLLSGPSGGPGQCVTKPHTHTQRECVSVCVRMRLRAYVRVYGEIRQSDVGTRHSRVVL